MKVFVYPQHRKGQTKNPYIENLEEALSKNFDIVHKEYKHRLPQPLRFLLQSTTADIYVFNWLEEGKQTRFATIRGLLSILGLLLVHFGRARIVWFFHNIHPHDGEDFWSRSIQYLLFRWSYKIVSHSAEAVEYAQKKARCPVFFRNHPIKIRSFDNMKTISEEFDFFIWGKIMPYKGVAEFLNARRMNKSRCTVLIIGKCDDHSLEAKIKEGIDDAILFENRSATFDEIAVRSKSSKYVLFPYIGDSVSSSGALMDTLQMGGTPVAPHRGAFADLSAEGCCITYKNIQEVFSLPMGSEALSLSEEKVSKFINNNSWNAFGEWLSHIIK